MTTLRYTLLTDGTSDKSLIKILDWLLESIIPEVSIQSEWADLGRLRNPPKELSERICASINWYPCDILFVHRDAENQSREKRIAEINAAVQSIKNQSCYIVRVVPIRMTEAWLLIDEMAIRRGAGNPCGKSPLNLPRIKKIESLSDPKATLQDLIKEASKISPRRQKLVSNHRIAELIDDFRPLEQLSAFNSLKQEVIQTLNQLSLL